MKVKVELVKPFVAEVEREIPNEYLWKAFKEPFYGNSPYNLTQKGAIEYISPYSKLIREEYPGEINFQNSKKKNIRIGCIKDENGNIIWEE